MKDDWHERLPQWAPYALTPLVMLAALPAIGAGSWLTLTIAGLTMGIMLFMVASGLTLIFGLMGIRVEFRPRGVRHRRRLHGRHGAGAAGRLDQADLACAAI